MYTDLCRHSEVPSLYFGCFTDAYEALSFILTDFKKGEASQFDCTYFVLSIMSVTPFCTIFLLCGKLTAGIIFFC